MMVIHIAMMDVLNIVQLKQDTFALGNCHFVVRFVEMGS